MTIRPETGVQLQHPRDARRRMLNYCVARVRQAARAVPATWHRRQWLIAVTLALSLASGVAWGFWSAGSVPGGNGASSAASVNQGATPTANAVGNAVTVSWSATTLSTGTAVNGYLIKRYDSVTLAQQTILSACTGTVASTSCVESSVPAGSWVYSVTPVFATNWQGGESLKSSAVNVGNAAPVAVANIYSVNEDATLNVSVAGILTNDSDADSDPITAILVSGVANGVLAVNSNGAFTYTPEANFQGSDSFTYKANDGVRDSNVVTVTITVTAANDAPVNAVPGPQQTPKNTNTVFSVANNNLVSISDADAGGSTVQVQLTATNGTVTLPVLTGLTFSVGDGTSDATMTFTGTITNINVRLAGATFIPTNNYTGAATLQIVTSDLGNTGTGGTLTDSDTITINVNSLGIFTANQDIGTTLDPLSAGSSAYSTGTYTVAGGGTDIWDNADHFQFLSRPMTGDGRLTAKVVSQTQTPLTSNPAKAGVMFRSALTAGSIHGMVDVMKANGSEFHWRLTTNGASGATTGTAGIAAPYWVRITRVGNVVTGERSVNGSTWVQQGATQSITLGSTIYAGLAVSAVNNTSLNTATFDNVAITTPPTAVGGSYTTNEDTTLNVAGPGVLWNDADPESNALTAVLVSGTTGLTLNANGSFDYVPPAGFTGAASFTYKANDGVFDSNTVTVNLTVNPANEIPSFTKGANQSAPVFLAQTVPGWATGISQGAGESGQLVNFTATNTNNAIFSVQPTVSPSGTLSYTASATTGVATVSVSIRDNGGTANGGIDTSAIQTFTITIAPDATGPTGGSVDASGLVGTGSRYATSTSLSLNLAKGTDPSGLAASGAQLTRATATVTGGVCGAFGSYTLVSGGTDPATPKSDTVSDQACFSYRYLVHDTVGNPTTYTSPDIKVDLTAPSTPTLVNSAFTNTWWSAGSTVYYRSAATSGSFTATASSTDTASGIASYGFATFGTNWTSTPGALGVNTYSWSGAPAAPGTKNVTATNNATGTSANSPIVMTADDTAPSAGTVSYVNGSTAGTTVSVSFTTGTDGGSGIGTRLLQRATATLSGITCGTFGGFTTVSGGTNPSSPLVDTVGADTCYKYQYVVSDNVGNLHTATSANVAHSPYGAYYELDAGSGTTAVDSTANANTGTLQAGAGWTTGKVGPYALNLTGATNSFVDIASPVIDSSDSYTVSGWIKPTTTTGFQTIASIDGTTISPFYLQISGGVFQFTTRSSDSTGSTASTLTGGTAVAGTWYHVVGVHNNAANTISLYVNGTLQSTTAFSSPWQATGHTVIGRAKWNGAPVDFVNGAIDDVRFYDTVLNPADVSTLYDLGTDYSVLVGGNSALVNYWRLGEATTTSDSFTGTSGTTIQSHAGEIGATWIKHAISGATDAVLSSSGRARKSGSGTVGATYYSSATPPSANYTVEADVFVASSLAFDAIGLIGRADTANALGTFYTVRYDADSRLFVMYSRVNGSWDWIGQSGSYPLTVGATYRVALDMSGSTIRVLVDGVEVATAVSTTITAAGRGGFALGHGNAVTTVTDSTGMHLDNIRTTPQLADSKGTNHGDYLSGPVLGAAGAIAGDANTAAQFDGVNDYATAARQVSDDLSIELWFKSTQTFSNDLGNPHCTKWWQGAGLVDAEVSGGQNDFGISLCDGRIVAGTGFTDVSVVSPTGMNNGAWHHVAFTRTRSTGAMQLYVDGVSVGTATGDTTSLTTSPTVAFGRIQGMNNYYAGYLDEISTYNVALTGAAVLGHYNAAQ